MGECLACDLTAGREELPGGEIHSTAAWLVEHCVGPLGVGTLIVKPRRHVIHVADLEFEEVSELGSVLVLACRVVTSLLEPQQVYTTLWSHTGGEPGHIHWVVQPVTTAVRASHGDLYGPMLQVEMFERDVTPDPDEVAAFAEKARAMFREITRTV